MAVIDPYVNGLFSENPYADNAKIEGRLVTVLNASLAGRGLQLIKPISRAVRRFDVHELILTDEQNAGPGNTVQQVWYAGFFEVLEGGMLLTGQKVLVGEHLLGTIAGFDETHMPNHLNIVIRAERPATGTQIGLQLGDAVTMSGGTSSETESDEKSCRKLRIWNYW